MIREVEVRGDDEKGWCRVEAFVLVYIKGNFEEEMRTEGDGE